MYSSALPQGHRYSVLHLRTRAYPCKPPVLSHPKPYTLKAKHLLLVVERSTLCIVVGIELYVYLSCHGELLDRHVFVLKADTSGLALQRVLVAAIARKFVQSVVNLDPAVYLATATVSKQPAAKVEVEPSEFDTVVLLRQLAGRLRQKPNLDESETSRLPVETPTQVQTRISLFTRLAHAYLFPNSDKNAGKHVADGHQLFRWWLNVLDGIVDEKWDNKADIPGSTPDAVLRFLPSKIWATGNIYVEKNPDEKAIYSIPLFPDDPKGRFLEHLIVENRHKTQTAQQFWAELGFRQEFRLGNVVGIIGCSKPLEKLAGASESDTVVVSLKNYKKISSLVRGADYSVKEDIQALCDTGLPDLFHRIRVEYTPVEVVGTKKPVASAAKTASNGVNVLSVKRKAPVNNLNSLVKRKH